MQRKEFHGTNAVATLHMRANIALCHYTNMSLSGPKIVTFLHKISVILDSGLRLNYGFDVKLEIVG